MIKYRSVIVIAQTETPEDEKAREEETSPKDIKMRKGLESHCDNTNDSFYYTEVQF